MAFCGEKTAIRLPWKTPGVPRFPLIGLGSVNWSQKGKQIKLVVGDHNLKLYKLQIRRSIRHELNHAGRIFQSPAEDSR